MGQLVRTCQALYDITKVYGTPLVSGKDSMKNDFRGKNGRGEPLTISILPTLLVTALSRGSLKRSQSSSFKNSGDQIYWIGKREQGLIGSEYAEHFSISDGEMSILDVDVKMNLALYRRIKTGLDLGLFHSIHDISDGGVLCALAECCFGNMMGIQIMLPERLQDYVLLYRYHVLDFLLKAIINHILYVHMYFHNEVVYKNHDEQIYHHIFHFCRIINHDTNLSKIQCHEI